jgi:hypothetical protein
MPNVQIIDNYSIINKSYLKVKDRFPALYREVLTHDKVTSSSWYELSDKAYSQYTKYWRESYDFYCASRRKCDSVPNCPDCFKCPDRLHKWPTLNQFEKEFKEEYSLDWPVWSRLNAPPLNNIYPAWQFHRLKNVREHKLFNLTLIVCACSRFGSPDDEWTPVEDDEEGS